MHPSPLRPDVPDRDPGRPEHRPDRLAVDVRPGQPVRLHRDAVPQGRRRPGHRPDRLPDRGRGGPVRHRAGQRAARRATAGSPRTGCWSAARAARSTTSTPDDGRLHGRLAAPDGVGRDRDDPVPRARRRQPRADGRQHAAPGGAAAAQARRRWSAPAWSTGPRSTPATWSSPRSAAWSRTCAPTTSPCMHDDGTAAPTCCTSSAGPTRAPASTRSRSSTRATGSRPARSSPTVRAPTSGEMALGQEPARRVHAVGGPQLRGRDHPVASASCRTTCSPRSTSRSTRSTPATPSSGPEEITRDIPNVSEEMLADLDERGIIRIGAEVVPRRHPGRQGHARRARPS